MDFSETIVACKLKVGRCRQLIELKGICEYLSSRSFLNLDPRLFTYENKTLEKPLGHFQEAFRNNEMKIY